MADLTDSTLRYSGNTDNTHCYLFIDGFQGTSLSVPVSTGHAYKFWMHTMASNFSYSDPTSYSFSTGTTFSVATSDSNMVVNRSLSPSALSVAPGQNVSVLVTDSPSTPADWVALAPVGSTATHIPGNWLYLNGSQTEPTSADSTATLTFAMPLTAGQYEFRLYTDNSGTVLARSAAITVGSSSAPLPQAPPPAVITLTPSTTSTSVGGTVTVSVSDSDAAPGDWLAVAPVGSTATHIPGYWFYLNGTQTAPSTAITSATLTFTMPSTAGQYEFRLYSNDTFNLAATSAPVTVGGSSPPPPPPPPPATVATLVASPTNVGPSGTVTVSVSNSSPTVGDYVAIAPLGSTATHIAGYWLYMSGLQSRPSSPVGSATLTFTMPPTAGQYEFRLYANDTFTQIAASAPVTVGSSPATPSAVMTLTPLATTAAPGGTLALNFTDTQAAVGDWIGMAPAGSTTTTYIPGYWFYLGGAQTRPSTPVTSGTLTFTMPPTAGQYEFRLFSNDTFNIAATSVPVTIASSTSTAPPPPPPQPPPQPSSTQSLTPLGTTAAAGGTISVSVTDNPSMPRDFVAIALVGSTATHIPGYWLYLNGSQTAPATAPTSATLTFNVPPTAGQYEFRLYANDTFTLLTTSAPITVTDTSSSSSGGTGSSGGSVSSGGLFPLQVSSNRKYLVDQSGRPFMVVGDTAWSLVNQVGQSDVTRYLDDRKSRGFTAVLVELSEHMFTTHSPACANAYGQVPFYNNSDFTTANDAYFAELDYVVQQALSRGMLVFLCPSYWGSNPGVNGWGAEMKANGVAKLTSYGQYLGNRYRTYPNIVWVHGGDWLPSTSGSPSELDLVSAVANGIISAGGGQLHTAHWKDHSDTILGISWLNLDATYAYDGLHTYAMTVPHASMEIGVHPSFFLEGSYENTYSSSDPNANTTAVLRAQMYQPILSGQMGFFFGNTPLWFLGNPGDGNPGNQYSVNKIGWGTALASPGARSVTVASRFFSSINWQLLYPDTSRLLAPSGYGSYGSDSYALAALSSDKRLGVIYYTASQNVTVNLWSMAGPVQAQWFDPATGNSSTVSGSPFPNSGTHTFTPPGANGDGSADWVLLLQSN